MTGNSTESEIYIPLEPLKKRRFGIMLSQSLPGIVLILSVVGTSPNTVGEYLLNLFCVVAGGLLMFFSIREYKFPGKGKKPGADTIMVFSGLIVIAQGTQVFDALKGFQPAHLYFLAGGIFIFKGVMFPESKIRRGFIISKDSIVYRNSLLKSPVQLSKINLTDIFVTENKINFQYHNKSIHSINLKGNANLEILVNALKREVLL